MAVADQEDAGVVRVGVLDDPGQLRRAGGAGLIDDDQVPGVPAEVVVAAHPTGERGDGLGAVDRLGEPGDGLAARGEPVDGCAVALPGVPERGEHRRLAAAGRRFEDSGEPVRAQDVASRRALVIAELDAVDLLGEVGWVAFMPRAAAGQGESVGFLGDHLAGGSDLSPFFFCIELASS